MRPEPACILSDTPALGFEAPDRSRHLERMRRQPRGPILLGVEAREMLPDDVLGLVAFGPRGSGVPVGHDAVEVQHVDGVVRHALDEVTEAPLALQGGGFGLALLGPVPGDLGEADRHAGVVADEIDDDMRPKPASILSQPPAFGFEPAD